MNGHFKKILITGAGGMLGSDLADALRGTAELCGVGRRAADQLSIPFICADLSDAAQCEKVVSAFRPEVIFHCAAMTDVDGCENRPEEALRNNLTATQNLVAAANAARSLIIFFSTDYVFNGTKTSPYLEADPVCPINTYGESKALAEKYIAEKAQNYLIFRVSWLYGQRGKSFPRTILEKAKTQNHFRIVNDQVGCPTYTRDLAASFQILLGKGKDFLEKQYGQIFHLANQGAVSWADFAAYILMKNGFEGASVEKIASEELNRPAKRPKNSVLSLEKAGRILGMHLRSWEEAVSDFIFQSGLV